MTSIKINKEEILKKIVRKRILLQNNNRAAALAGSCNDFFASCCNCCGSSSSSYSSSYSSYISSNISSSRYSSSSNDSSSSYTSSNQSSETSSGSQSSETSSDISSIISSGGSSSNSSSSTGSSLGLSIMSMYSNLSNDIVVPNWTTYLFDIMKPVMNTNLFSSYALTGHSLFGKDLSQIEIILYIKDWAEYNKNIHLFDSIRPRTFNGLPISYFITETQSDSLIEFNVTNNTLYVPSAFPINGRNIQENLDLSKIINKNFSIKENDDPFELKWE